MLFFIFFISIAYAYNVEDDGLIKEEEVFPDLSYKEDENVNQINDINDLFNLFKYVRQVPDENDRRDFPGEFKFFFVDFYFLNGFFFFFLNKNHCCMFSKEIDLSMALMN